MAQTFMHRHTQESGCPALRGGCEGRAPDCRSRIGLGRESGIARTPIPTASVAERRRTLAPEYRWLPGAIEEYENGVPHFSLLLREVGVFDRVQPKGRNSWVSAERNGTDSRRTAEMTRTNHRGSIATRPCKERKDGTPRVE